MSAGGCRSALVVVLSPMHSTCRPQVIRPFISVLGGDTRYFLDTLIFISSIFMGRIICRLIGLNGKQSGLWIGCLNF